MQTSLILRDTGRKPAALSDLISFTPMTTAFVVAVALSVVGLWSLLLLLLSGPVEAVVKRRATR